MFKKVNPRQNFPQQEDEILDFWKKHRIFEKQVEQGSEKDKYVFYDGPPFITGLPHYGHLLGSIAKDVIPRYHAMQGKRVDRVWGWDCHGLPIENKVEKKLDLKNRKDIEKLGLDKFAEECYKYTREVSAEWDWYVDRIGRWVDIDRAYRTMDQDYIETVMWVFKELHTKKLVYEGVRTSLYCPRCGTPVSNFEIAMDDSYTDMDDPAVTIKFKLKSGNKNFQIDEKIPTYMLAWTTTPWTLPSNRALVVDDKGKYVKVRKKVKIVDIHGSAAVIYNPKKKQFLTLIFDFDKPVGIYDLVKGSQKDGETLEQTILREVVEETGYTDLNLVKKLGSYKYQNFRSTNIRHTKDYNMYLIELNSEKKQKQQLEEGEKFDLEWVDEEQFLDKLFYPAAKLFGKKAYDYYKFDKEIVEERLEEDMICETDYEEDLILGLERVNDVLQTGTYEIIEEIEGKNLVGLEYEGLFDYFPPNKNDWKVYSYKGMVSADEGVGIVHSAPGFGEIDTEMGKHYDLTMMFSVNDEGKFVSEVTDYAGMFYKDADKFIIKNLIDRNLLFDYSVITHRFPYCYRCETPLLYKSQSSWYLNVDELRQKLLANNENINWFPSHTDNRFKAGIEQAPDWCVSRTRYWGTPMPVWQAVDEDGKVLERLVIGSRDELMERNDDIVKMIFLRHGDVEDNSDFNSGLSEEGKKKVLQNIKDLSIDKVDVILSSSILSCTETAEVLSNHFKTEVVVDERFGSVDRKKKVEEIKQKFSDFPARKMPQEQIDEIESTFFKEDKKTLDDIYSEYKGKTVLIVTHAEVVTNFRYLLEGGNYISYIKRRPRYGEIFTTYMYEGKLLDLHRPVIDNIVLRGDKEKELKRVEETLDVWMESASMPYAQLHYPFENKDDLEANFPADYVSEYIAQTRAWFYVMHVIGTALFNKNPFKNVVVSGVILGTDGRKMSKSYGNYPDPAKVLGEYGGDAFRLYILNSSLLNAGTVPMNEDEIKGQLKDFILPLWNSYSFLLTYADIHNWKPEEEIFSNPPKSENNLDKWVISKFNEFLQNVNDQFLAYNMPQATSNLYEFLLDLSKWYIRRSRDRFRDGDNDAMSTLYYILVQYIKAIAPFTPFISEAIYQNLVREVSTDQPESVHLCKYPMPDKKLISSSKKMLSQMEVVRSVCNLGQSIRVENGFKVRQPLASIYIESKDGVEGWMEEIILDELNIKNIETGEKDGEGFLQTEDVKLGIKISVDTNLTEELKQEGLYRELVRQIQAWRKKKGLKFGEMVDIEVNTEDSELREVIEKMGDELKSDTNVKDLVQRWSISAKAATDKNFESTTAQIDRNIEDGNELKVNGKVIQVVMSSIN